MDNSLFLNPAELAALDDEQLTRYLELLEKVEGAWELNPKQKIAHNLAFEVDELLFGGAAGGGKSEMLLFHAYDLSQRFRNHRTLALRRTFQQLRDTLIQRSRERFDPEVARYGVTEKRWEFKETGSTIQFGHCENEDDVKNYLSAEYDCILIEESTEFTERMYLMLRSRNRTNARKRAQGIRPHTICATNPGQVGHKFFKERFVVPTNYGSSVARTVLEVHGRRREVTVAFVQSKVTDNPHIDPDYIFNLQQLPEVERKQYLDGDWDVFAGQYFPEFNKAFHVIPTRSIDPSWKRLRGLDYGFGNPYACVWVAFDHDGNAWVYRERYGSGFTAAAQGRKIREASVMVDEHDREVPEVFVSTQADPSIWSREGSGLSIEAQYRAEGIICRKAMNKRLDGWSRFRDWLRGDGTADGGAALYIMDCCPNLIRELTDAQFDRDKPEDLDTRGSDHALDALRYVLATRPPRTKRRPTEADRTADVDRDLDRIVRESARGPLHPVLGRV